MLLLYTSVFLKSIVYFIFSELFLMNFVSFYLK
nr:MAG TPA: hypothetical protein [Caudoviricetes sp.]